ncbi:MAG: PAS domain S-box protein [Lentisphaerae bacterium]|nr:PAS domain S-box protein [Lentisphaerota bacterium]MCP4102183.1 PAS domain S-box protein [Lentisphaerota bacterium]
MKSDTLQYLPLLIFILAAMLLGFIWYQSSSLEKVYLNRIKTEMLVRGKLLKPEISKIMHREDRLKALNKVASAVAENIQTRITIIAPDGSVTYDSSEAAHNMGNHLRRPEIFRAFKGKASSSVRYSSTLSTRMIYSAIPMTINGKTYVLRTAVSIRQIDHILQQARRDILLFGLLVALVTGCLSFYIVRGIIKPIENLKFNAARISAGNLDIKLPIPEKGAIRDLALSLSHMAEQLKNRIGQISVEKKKRDAIFTSMSEGVVALDMEGNIIDLNRAAANLLDLPDNAVGLSFCGVVRNNELQEFVEMVLNDKETMETELVLFTIQESFVRVRGTVMRGIDNILGAVFVLSDITKIKKLENFRRDFIADVSHEIKTPLTAIRGAVETLEEGAIDEKETAHKFMHIITRHTDRLNSLVHDILSLSSLERKTHNEEQDFATIKISGPVSTAIELCREKANSKRIKIDFEDKCPTCKVKGDCQLIEQAIINLIDNAIKYSEDNTRINVKLCSYRKKVIIKVKDNGCGIPPEHLSRLFERFYRVDKARSRKVGGTGLGLAIVKHIAQLHKGSVDVDSHVGEGSTFAIKIPHDQT